jgi:hypothetical protein
MTLLASAIASAHSFSASPLYIVYGVITCIVFKFSLTLGSLQVSIHIRIIKFNSQIIIGQCFREVLIHKQRVGGLESIIRTGHSRHPAGLIAEIELVLQLALSAIVVTNICFIVA